MKQELQGLSLFGTTLAFVSTIIGGGIVGVPFAFYHAGIPMGILINFLGAFATSFSCYLYLKAKDFCGFESMSEIGFVLVGRKSVFILNGIISISSFGLMMIYFIVFGDIAASITKENMDNPNNFICTRAFFVLIISTALLPLILKKEIAHLKLASILLFLAILLFIIIFIVQFITKGNFDNHDLSYKKYYEFKFDQELITAISIIFVAYGFQQNLFPTYRSMKVKTNEFGMKAVIFSIILSMIIYTSLAFLAVYMFGSSIKASVLDNIGGQKFLWESYVLRFAFLIVIGCHIPFIFFSGKESFLIILDEIDRRSVSKALENLITNNTEYKPSELDCLVISKNSTRGDYFPATPKQIQNIALKTMKSSHYYMATLGMYILSIIGAIFIDEVGVIFEFVGAISSSTISFIIPGYFYIATEKLYGNKLLGNIWTRRISFVFIVLGIIIFFLLFIGSIFNLADSNVE